MNNRELMEFLHIANNLKEYTRHSVSESGRWESVADHSWRVALLALLLEDELADADFNKILRMCIVHDLGEAITKDIPSFWKSEADSKHEDAVLFEWMDSIAEPQRSKLQALFTEMLALETREAKIYKALDKIEAVIQHNEAPLSGWLPLEYELNQTYGEKEAKQADPRLAELRQMAKEDTIEKIEKGI